MNFKAFQLHVDWLALRCYVLFVILPDIIEKGMVEGLLDSHALIWIEFQRMLQEVLGLDRQILK
jgi:hypothetical protein